jgi:hypothetical protein
VPPSGAIKPKPLSLLNHFTVPSVIYFSLLSHWMQSMHP